MTLQQLLLAGLGGFIGSICRYWMSTRAYRVFGQNFPYGTLTVNVLGSFFDRLPHDIFEERFVVNPGLRIFLTVGILGGFTTFSSFSFETVALLQEGSYWIGSVNILASVATCLLSTWLGVTAGKLF